MKDSISKVEKFHAAFGHPVETSLTTAPDVHDLWFDLIHEELYEYKQSCKRADIVGIADALGDLLVVVFGAVLCHGLQDHIKPVFNEIMRANMSKLGEDGKPVYRDDNKILKGPNYSPPNIEKIINASKSK